MSEGEARVESEKDLELEAELASGMFETSRGSEELVVLPVYGEPPQYYCSLRRPKGPVLCAVQPDRGGYTVGDDGGGDPVWIVAGAALPTKLAVAVVRAFQRGEPPVLPFVPGLVYHEGGGTFIDWSGPDPQRRASHELAVELDGDPEPSLASSGVWQALTHVTVRTPEWLAFIASHPLPGLRRLCIWFLDLIGQQAVLQAALDAHPHMTALRLDANQVANLPPLSAPQLRRLILEYDFDDDDEGEAIQQVATSSVSRWRLEENVEILTGFVGMFDLNDPDFSSDVPL
ncbi:hypothetical protein [Polyangium sorediatum]|uniref:Leucine-rich repeat domain-containing protein n=1 Tax=Polyangium sorediatum TaxID=889274 RepID=A0ABT6NSY4_9BACT|nr:hypothetical protein [Polyangium sorediatum]MDI1431401.1 hypothetical protein [Polyangium sorediatum]